MLVKYISLPMIILGVVGGLYYTRTTFPIQPSPVDPKNFPVVSWWQVTDGQLAYSLDRQVKEGKIQVALDQAQPMTKFEVTPDWYVANVGIKKLTRNT